MLDFLRSREFKFGVKALLVCLGLIFFLMWATIYYAFNILGSGNFSSVSDDDNVSMIECLESHRIKYRVFDGRIEVSFPNIDRVEEQCPIEIVPLRG